LQIEDKLYIFLGGGTTSIRGADRQTD
jgi:hypothetical protein